MKVPQTTQAIYHYQHTFFSNPAKLCHLGQLNSNCLALFMQMCSHLKRPYRNPRANTWHDAEFILAHTLIDLDFNAVERQFNKRTYLAAFNALKQERAILKVNPTNIRCHKYYINPDYAHTLERKYKSDVACQCDIYHHHYATMWTT